MAEQFLYHQNLLEEARLVLLQDLLDTKPSPLPIIIKIDESRPVGCRAIALLPHGKDQGGGTTLGRD